MAECRDNESFTTDFSHSNAGEISDIILGFSGRKENNLLFKQKFGSLQDNFIRGAHYSFPLSDTQRGTVGSADSATAFSAFFKQRLRCFCTAAVTKMMNVSESGKFRHIAEVKF